jgi:DNA mismatch endonuclease (patch repair protein)
MDRSANMRAIRGKDTSTEMTVRRLVHRLGYRFRLHRKGLPGKPDLVFVSRRKVIFVHGCFWHSHACKPSLVPKSNRDFWLSKLQRNKVRDKENLQSLAAKNWEALVIWQCELKDIEALAAKIEDFLKSSPSSS